MMRLSIPIPAVALSASAIALLSGCTNMSGLGGSSDYGCKAPPGVQCDSVSGNYYNAMQNNLPSQRRRRAPDAGDTAGTPTRRTAGFATSAAPPTTDAVSPAVGRATIAAVTPLPLRSEARVLRLWFKPWEDADHDLYDQGYIFVQIDSGGWLIDHAQRRIRDAYAPIRPPKPAAAPSLPSVPNATTSPGANLSPDNASGPVVEVLKPFATPPGLPAGDEQ